MVRRIRARYSPRNGCSLVALSMRTMPARNGCPTFRPRILRSGGTVFPHCCVSGAFRRSRRGHRRYCSFCCTGRTTARIFRPNQGRCGPDPAGRDSPIWTLDHTRRRGQALRHAFLLVPGTTDRQSEIRRARNCVGAVGRHQDLIALARNGERSIMFPTLLNLMRLAESADVDSALTAAAARPKFTVVPRVENPKAQCFS